ncbi:MAG: NADH-quinone oxidoreductase subunit M [Acinetobacter sp.]|nr:NADH-quinone oxidoreductase subunit M [Acinetobacter sp.]
MDIFLSIPFLIFMPLVVSMLLISPLFTRNEIVVRRFAKSVFGFHFLYAVLMLIFFDSANPYVSQIHFYGLDWIQSIGVKFIFKIDNISMILTLLTSFVFLLASFASKFNIRTNHKFYYSMLMLLMSAILGIFTAGDMFVFFLFWELELIPAYFLIGGGWKNETDDELKRAQSSAIKFVLFTFLGSMVMLLGILLLHYYNFISNGILSAVFSDINASSIPDYIQYLISICILIGFGVKLPIIPLHTWLPDAHTNAPTPVSMILAGILLKTGAYGIYRFNYETLSDAFITIAPVLAVFALINIIYTAFVAYAQTDIKRIVAYSSISNMGLILLGLCAINKIGLSASVFHMVAHALVTCGLFMIAGIVYLRCKNRDINTLSGIAVVMPRLFGFAMVIVLASIGIPAFAPFISEILTMIGALNADFSDVLKLVSVFSLPLLILSSCYMLKFLHKGFFGELPEAYEKVNDITVHEFIVLASVLAGLVIFGLFPQTILGMLGG